MLLEVWAFCALVSVVFGQSTTMAPNTSSAVYTVIAPAKLRPNIPFHVSASAHNLQSPLDLKIGIEGPADNGQYNNIGKQITLNSGETQILNFEIGEWSSGNYSLIVKGEGGMSFQNETVLTYEHKSYSVFIQTDKAIYKPGQLVQFRVLVVSPHLLPSVIGAINMYITDANGNLIKQWGKVFTTKGIASADLLLSDQPVLGDWTINVDILGQIFKKTFTVAEYVLPNFEVQLSLPSYITYSKPDCVATVTAKYTYGKPVKGHVKVTVKPSLRFGYLADEKPSVTEAEIDGSIDIPLNLVRDLSLKEDTLVLEIDVVAEVEEYLTKRKYNTTGVIKMYDRDVKVELIKTSESYKPGLKYTAHLKVCYQDDTPVVVTNGDQIVLKYGYTFDDREWESRRIAVPSNGLVSVDFYPPVNANASSLSMNAEFRGFTYHQDNIETAMSPSNSFIQVLLRTENPTVDKEIELEINATEPVSHLVYEVLGRGDIVLANAIAVPNVKTYRFSIPVTYKMAPKARVVVFYVRPENNEIVADAVNFDVAGVFRTPVSVSTSVKQTKPGAPLNVTVATRPNALVGLLGVDQSVLLLKSGNDITQNDVITELETYDGGKKKMRYNPFYRRKRSLWWPGSATAYEVFDDSGVVVLTNGLVYRYIQLIMYRSYNPMRESLDDELNAVDTMMYNHGNGRGSKPRVRKNFPETWIWDLAAAGNDGKLSLAKTVPDTITSWVISAFAMDPVNGLGIATENAKVTVFRPFFVKLNLPYSIIRSESLYLEVIVFNYNKKPMKADVTLENSNGDFEFTVAGNEIRDSQDKMTKTVEVPAEDGISVLFLITPKTLGYIDIKVSAIANNAGDSVVRKLLVKPEGSPHYFNKALLVDLRDPNGKKMDSTVQISVPKEAVPGSTSVTLSAIGDLLGPTVNNLDKLLRMPHGCGEQNMLNFVPNIVITKYLKRVNRLTPAIQKKALNYMESGYQRELTYRRNDGSFSAFGNSDKNGSTWLTAFVVRSFHQAKEFMEIDELIMNNALEWLAKQQKGDGSFSEPGEVHHKAMQGGSGAKNALTAYVLLAFLENQAQKTFGQEMDKASKFLSRELKNTQDPYFVSIVTYAFHLSEHSEKDVALQKLLSLSTRGVDTINWQKPADKSASYYLPQSQDVEMTAYALLTYTVRGDVAGSLPILRWLISQQNENGGYSSTQDTVVGIQALAALGMRLASTSISINITYNSNDIRKTLSINSENAMVLQKVILPSDTRSVSLQAEGFGVGLVQVTWSYNLESSEKAPAFTLKPVLGKASTDDYMELDICTSFNEVGSSNMAVMEVGLPSGFQADTETLPMIKKLQKIKRVETEDGDTNVVIYFDRIGGDEMCVNVPAYRNHKVANQKPVPVRVYDYYDLSKSARMFYEPKAVSLCNLCEGQDCGRGCNELTDGVNSSPSLLHNMGAIMISLCAIYFLRKTCWAAY